MSFTQNTASNNLECFSSRTQRSAILNVFHPEHNEQQSWISFTQNTTSNNLECLSPRTQPTTILNVFHPEHNEQQSRMSFTQNTTSNNLECLSPRTQRTTILNVFHPENKQKQNTVVFQIFPANIRKSAVENFNLPLTKIACNARQLCKATYLSDFQHDVAWHREIQAPMISYWDTIFRYRAYALASQFLSYCCDPLPFNQTKNVTQKSLMLSKW